MTAFQYGLVAALIAVAVIVFFTSIQTPSDRCPKGTAFAESVHVCMPNKG